MDIISKIQETDIPATAVPTFNAIAPLLELKRAQILSAPKKTFQFGPTERHQLDIYYPTATFDAGGGDKSPILFFIYGGGFTAGQRNFPPPFDLGYANIGAYFGQRGIITVIPDYRLVPDFVFPAAAEDVRDAVSWVVQHSEHLVSTYSPNPDLSALAILGHSAGAVHTATGLLLPESSLRAHAALAFLFGGAYSFQGNDHGLHDVVLQLWGSEQGIQEKAPLGLLKQATDEHVQELPEIVLLDSERDPDWMLNAAKLFRTALQERKGSPVENIVALGHNHVSPTWVLGIGEGEDWAEEVVKRMKNLIR